MRGSHMRCLAACHAILSTAGARLALDFNRYEREFRGIFGRTP